MAAQNKMNNRSRCQQGLWYGGEEILKGNGFQPFLISNLPPNVMAPEYLLLSV